jgi:opacity protein-like surface antigen
MTRTRRLLVPVLLLAAGVAQPALAQTTPPLSFEVRGGAGLPVSDFSDGVGSGWIVGGTVRYQANPGWNVYAGLDFASFPLDEQDSDVDVRIRDYGLRTGIRTDLRFAAAPGATPWLEFGLLVNRASVRASAGEMSATVDSDWALGFEAGAGVSVPFSPRASFTPGVRYRLYRTGFDDVEGKADVEYFVVDLGIKVRL